MINGVSNVSGVAFKSTAADKVTPELINKPGSFEKEDVVNLSTKKAKKGGVLKTIAGMLVTAGVVVGGLVLAAKKGWTKALPEGSEKMMDKLSDKLFNVGNSVAKFFTKHWEKLTSEKVTETIEEVVEEVVDSGAKV